MSDLLEHTSFDVRRTKGTRLEKNFELCDESGGRIGEVHEEGISAGQSIIRFWTAKGGAAKRLIVLDEQRDPVFWVSGATQKPILVWDADGNAAGRIVVEKKGLREQRWRLEDAEGERVGSLERSGLTGPYRYADADGVTLGSFSFQLTSGKKLLFHSTQHEVLHVAPEASRQARLLMVAMAVSHADSLI